MLTLSGLVIGILSLSAAGLLFASFLSLVSKNEDVDKRVFQFTICFAISVIALVVLSYVPGFVEVLQNASYPWNY